MRAKVDINEVETRTKIRAKYLRAMENEEWDLLPGDVYIRSFLRTYGEFLGLDARALVDDFRRQYENPADHEPPPIAPPSRDRRDRERPPRGGPGRGVPPWAIIGVVLVVVVAVLYIVGTHNNSSKTDTTPPRSAQTSHRHHTTKRHRTKAAHKAPARPSVVHLSLVPTGAVYVCLVNGTGKRLIPGTIYNVGETIPVQTGSKLLLTLGNAQVTMKANGATIPVTASSGAIGYQFTPSGHSLLPPSKQPTCT